MAVAISYASCGSCGCTFAIVADPSRLRDDHAAAKRFVAAIRSAEDGYPVATRRHRAEGHHRWSLMVDRGCDHAPVELVGDMPDVTIVEMT